MRASLSLVTAIAAVVLPAHVAPAQTPAGIPPVRRLDRVVASSAELSTVSQVRSLPGGRVLINESGARRLVLADSTFATIKFILDTTGSTDIRYPRAGGVLVPYRGDTTLFLDRDASAFLVLDGAGKVTRTMAAPSGRGGSIGATARTNAAGRILYTANSGRSSADPTGGPGARMSISSSYLLAYDLDARRVDTAVVLRMDTTRTAAPVAGAPPLPSALAGSATTLFPVRDATVVLEDGTVAIVRALDYHVDWIAPSGVRTSSGRIPHEWKRLTDDEKQRMADSITVVRDSANQRMLSNLRPGDQALYDAGGRIIGIMTSVSAGGVALPPRPPTLPPAQAMQPVSPTVIPDFLPPIAGDALADPENRLWIRLHEKIARYPDQIFDIIDRSGRLVERIQPPQGQIVGFGPGAVYLFVRDGGVGKLIRVLTR
jgi:hypothetical protein